MASGMSFIEKQFPVSKVSKESYKERMANNSQTLTGLGKWWGRKPLILVRAAILGCLMPCGDNPRADMDIFLKILSMDDDGLADRKDKAIPVKELYRITKGSRRFRQYLEEWFEADGAGVKIRPGQDRERIEARLFKTLGYDEKLKYCARPEQLPNLRESSWNSINHHLGTSARSLPELAEQLAVKRYGRPITVGDCFCGGGSIPFEAARMGIRAYGSDLNPVAGLLTWAGINILGAEDDEIARVREFQEKVYDEVDREITELGIEHSEKGDRAVSYIYCVEARCPECGTLVPLAPSWVIGRGTRTVAILEKKGNSYEISVKMGANAREMAAAQKGTVTSKGMACPCCNATTPITTLRGDRRADDGSPLYGLRQWERSDFDFREGDVFRERLYAVKYQTAAGERYYRAPNEHDMANEARVKKMVAENLTDWQERGFVPDTAIEEGDKTIELIRNRGWTHWHHLFSPRQLLLLCKICKCVNEEEKTLNKVAGLLGLNKCVDWNSRLCRWNSGLGNEKPEQTFYNQAFNSLMNWGVRSLLGASTSWFYDINQSFTKLNSEVDILDARVVRKVCDCWVTDPPYADAVNYHELSEFFLAWDKFLLQEAFPGWYADSKRVLAVTGDDHFSQTMIDIYSNLAAQMPDDGMQVVMFTHSDPAVWAQLALIMWKAGLKVTAAWNIATETDAAGLKDGNYVKGTVLLALRKLTGDDAAFLDEINADIRTEVRRQIAQMLDLEKGEEPNFSDPDFVLAAYAASLKVLTSYKTIGDLNLDYELGLAINDPAKSSVIKIIEAAKKIAYDCVIPAGFEGYLWKDLTGAEKFYVKGLESEKRGNYKISTYQEYARGFNISGYGQLMASERANTARLKTPVEMAGRTLSDVPDFEGSLLRILFAAIFAGVKEDGNPAKALGHIKSELPDYWGARDMIKQLLDFLRDTRDIDNMAPHWGESAAMADLLYSLVDHDSI
ncbi:MAG: anti-phage-associated DUF1156 domain-containing protein [Aminivibrio sp.]|jgi:putative DNA methylase